MNESRNKLRSISLFSGYGGIALGLHQYSEPILYCDIEPYAQAVLLSRMDDGTLPFAPIWNDVTTLDGTKFRGMVDLIEGGFPCQDISVAGKGAGLEGQRSGLFREIIRLCEEASPVFVFLENVPAIRARGSVQVQEALASIGYDTRFGVISASEVGANHKRERWFCLGVRRDVANTYSPGRNGSHSSQSEKRNNHSVTTGAGETMAHSMLNGHTSSKVGRVPSEDSDYSPKRQNNGTITEGRQEALRWRDSESDGTLPDSISKQLRDESGGSSRKDREGQAFPGDDGTTRLMANTDMQGQCGEASPGSEEDHEGIREDYWWTVPSAPDRSWWQVEPRVGRVVDGCPNRAHRIKALGNGVVPLQVKEAFEILAGVQR
jgi:DNA (cytosine-5)-methyltransferase 1